MSYLLTIGLEIHVQLRTKTKLFSGASTRYDAADNTQACFIDLGLPGVLPVLNKQALDLAIQFGLSAGSTINKKNVFSRKNYFYPDLPKGYQITQDAYPIVQGGALSFMLDDKEHTVPLTRAHLEEDAGKSVHEGEEPGVTGIDLNRAGIPLLEIVTEPTMHSAKEAVALLKTIHSLIRYLGISTGNMQEGAMRCDVNVSVRPDKDAALGTRVEIKNVNSFKFVEKAIQHEYNRQVALISAGGHVLQETRLYDPDKNETRSLRQKEDANDYRYFPDPDLPIVYLDDPYIESIRAKLPELPWEKKARFMKEHGLNAYDAMVLTQDRALADYYEAIVQNIPHAKKIAANWVNVELQSYLNQNNLSIEDNPIHSDQLSDLISAIDAGKLSGKMGKDVLSALWENPEKTVSEIIEERGLEQISDPSALEPLVLKLLQQYPQQLAQYQSGKDKLFGFFVGQMMKETKGQANPSLINQLLKKHMDS